MPDLDNDLDLDQNADGDGAEGSEDDGGDAGAAAAGGDKPEGGKGDKRYSDLIAARDREAARANKAEQALKALNAADESGSSGSDDPERKALLVELREASLDAVYGEFSELKDYGIDRSLIDGQTRAEMRASATALVALVKGVATKARNKALSEHGIKAEPAGSSRTPAKSFDQMSDEEFERVIQEAKSGGAGFTW